MEELEEEKDAWLVSDESLGRIVECSSPCSDLLLSKEGILCAETGTDETMLEVVGQLHRIDQRRYGTIMLNFYELELR